MKRSPKYKTKTLYTLAVAAALLLYTLNPISDAHIRSRIVMLTGNGAACTGEQIRAPSGKDYILSAGHCTRVVSDGSVDVATEDGKHLRRAFIAEDPTSDLMLLEGLPNVQGLAVAGRLNRLDQVRTFTHGGRKPTYQGAGDVVGQDTAVVQVELDGDHCTASKYTLYPPGTPNALCFLSVEETVSTTPIISGSSGGPLLNTSGEVVGVASMVGEGFSYWVRLSDIREFLAGY